MTVQWHNEHLVIGLRKPKYKYIVLVCQSQAEYVRKVTPRFS